MYLFGVFFILLLATCLKNVSCDAATEAELLALTTSGKLLAPKRLAREIADDLEAIRAAYPQVSNIGYAPPWIPGELIAQVSDEQLKKIRIRYGDVTTRSMFDDWKVLTFTKQYNPEVLAKELTRKNLVESAEPNNIIGGGGSGIKFNGDVKNGVYTFSTQWGDCPAGCIFGHYWEFSVSENNNVQLVNEYGTPLESEAI